MATYTARKIGEYGWIVEKDGVELDPTSSQKLWNHSPDGFSWGYGGSGPAQLALALLLDVGTPDADAVKLHQHFKREVIAALDINAGWTMTTEDIEGWLGRQVWHAITDQYGGIRVGPAVEFRYNNGDTCHAEHHQEGSILYGLDGECSHRTPDEGMPLERS